MTAPARSYCTSCDGTGVVLCYCVGDVCTCGREEIACPDCDGCPIPAADEGGG